jgi:hypothetical protein
VSEKKRWLLVVVFATAMAWMESATVAYLRTLVDRIEPYQINPLPIAPNLGEAELVREIATLIMLFAAGWLSGNTRHKRVGYTLIAFGVWDILYYVFLKIIVDWPYSIGDWDILFLLPLPWWGLVIAPASIAAMMVITGTLITQFKQSNQPIWPSRWAWRLNLIGAALALYVFMSDALRLLGDGIETIRSVLPSSFNWPLFILASILVAAPIGDMFKQIWKGRNVHQERAGISRQVNFGASTIFLILLYKLISSDT